MKPLPHLATLLLTLTLTCPAQKTHHLPLASLPQNTRELFTQSITLMNESYDPAVHLLRRPYGTGPHVHGDYMVRESSWYALALLLRDAPGDRSRAAGILDAVLQEQYLDPAAKWYGTFKRTPEEPLPAPGTAAFTGYDPNWRVFVGTTFQIILLEYSDRIPSDLAARLDCSIDLALEGEIRDGRLQPSYTNIALMYGALWDFAAQRNGNPARNPTWREQSKQWTEAVYALFAPNHAFAEYNAPTYCGVDLYGLALWRDYGSTPRIRHLGAVMASALWTDLSLFYQPSLRNLAGPYDRAYGMDMSVYVTPTGDWLRTVLPASLAPLPEHPTLGTFQVADLWFAPQIAVLGTRIPAATLARFQHFAGPHLVHRQIDPQRVATAWVGADAIWGGESTSLTRDTGRTQFHPVDVQWRMPSGEIGWIQLTRSPYLDAIADRQGISITTDGDISFRLYTGAATPTLTQTAWQLPGLTVNLITDATGFTTTPPDPAGESDLTYKAAKHLRFNLHPTAQQTR